jgi:hypothetical protein
MNYCINDYAPYSYVASNKTIDNVHTVRIEFRSMNVWGEAQHLYVEMTIPLFIAEQNLICY